MLVRMWKKPNPLVYNIDRYEEGHGLGTTKTKRYFYQKIIYQKINKENLAWSNDTISDHLSQNWNLYLNYTIKELLTISKEGK